MLEGTNSVPPGLLGRRDPTVRLRGLVAHLSPSGAPGNGAHGHRTRGVSAGELLSATVLKPEIGFGAVVDLTAGNPRPRALFTDPRLAHALRQLWYRSGGLVVLRGLHDLTPEQLVELSRVFGVVEENAGAAFGASDDENSLAGGTVVRIGNSRNPQTGRPNGAFFASQDLAPGVSPRYRPNDPLGKFSGTPLWHTDSCFREHPAIASLFYCKQTPVGGGGATCFADTRAAFDDLDQHAQTRLEAFECVCSFAHHEAKYHSVSPEWAPVLPESRRLAMPAQRQPLVLVHPVTAQKSLYGFNEGTFAVLPRGVAFSDEMLAAAESLDATEHPSMEEWRGGCGLLQHATQDRFTVVWQYQQGDCVVWDDRTTLHTATGFDHENCTREMWRTTIIEDHSRAVELACTLDVLPDRHGR